MQADVERLLARMLVAPALREHFLADPLTVAAAHGLADDEGRALAAVDADELRNAARSIAAKRRHARRPRGLRRAATSCDDGAIRVTVC
jgi:hypothetical protein